jgi:hypothetical protein
MPGRTAPSCDAPSTPSAGLSCLPKLDRRVAYGVPSRSRRIAAATANPWFVAIVAGLIATALFAGATAGYRHWRHSGESRTSPDEDVRALALAATEYEPGTAGAPGPTFNRFSDVPGVGDERDFVHVKVHRADGGFSNNLHVQPGDVILARVYIHNNADVSLNDGDGPGVAREVYVKLGLAPLATDAQSVELIGAIKSRNADPVEISDRAVVYSARPIELRFLEGSVAQTDNSGSRELPDSAIGEGRGSSIGDVPGCFAQVRLIAARFSVSPGKSGPPTR